MDAVARGRVVVEAHQEQNGTGDMDEGIGAVGPVEEEGVLEKPSLDIEFEEDVQALFKMDELQSVTASDIDSAFNHGHGGEGAAELVDLSDSQHGAIQTIASWRTQYISAQYQASTKKGNFRSSRDRK